MVKQRKGPSFKRNKRIYVGEDCRILQPGSKTLYAVSPNLRHFDVLFDLDSWVRSITGSGAITSKKFRKLLLHVVGDSDHPVVQKFGILTTKGVGHTIADSYGASSATDGDLLNGAVGSSSGITVKYLGGIAKYLPRGSGDTVHQWMARTIDLTSAANRILAIMGKGYSPDYNFNLVVFTSSPSSNTTVLRHTLEGEMVTVPHEDSRILK